MSWTNDSGNNSYSGSAYTPNLNNIFPDNTNNRPYNSSPNTFWSGGYAQNTGGLPYEFVSHPTAQQPYDPSYNQQSYDQTYSSAHNFQYYNMNPDPSTATPAYYYTQSGEDACMSLSSSHNTSFSPPPPPLPIEPPPPPPPQTIVYSSSQIFGPSSRSNRPRRLCIILRGLPGSGKSTMARQIRDIEKSHNVTVRILSTDDYFMSEFEESDSATIQLSKITNEKSLSVYSTSLEKAIRRTVEEDKFAVLLVDSCHISLSSFETLWSTSRRGGYDTLVAHLDVSVDVCVQRLLSTATYTSEQSTAIREALVHMSQRWDPPAPHMPLLDLRWLLGGGETKDVEMEEENEAAGGRSSSEVVFADDDEDDKEEEDDEDDVDVDRLLDRRHRTAGRPLADINSNADCDLRMSGLSRCRISDEDEDSLDTGSSASSASSQHRRPLFAAHPHVHTNLPLRSPPSSLSLSSPVGCLKRPRIEGVTAGQTDQSRDHLNVSVTPSTSTSRATTKRTRCVHWGAFKVIEIERVYPADEGEEESVGERHRDSSSNKLRVKRSEDKEGLYILRGRSLLGADDDEDEDEEEGNRSPTSSLCSPRSRGFEITGKPAQTMLTGAALERYRQEMSVVPPAVTVLAAPEDRLWKQPTRAVRHGPDRDRRPLFRSSSGESSNTDLFL